MEFFIALAIIIAITELKEFRLTKKLDRLNRKLESSTKLLHMIQNQLSVAKETIDANRNAISELGKKISSISDQLNELRPIIEEAHANSATILKEYELNGVPLGYQRKHPDFIESL